MSSLREILAGMAGVLGAAGCGYYALCLGSARQFLRDSRCAPRTAHRPPVSILKPLKGADPEMYEAFRSHCVQEYPEYELIFGVGDADDPAAALVRQLQAEFPERSIRLEVCPKVLGANRKVSTLAQMLPLARFDHVIVNDSDIRVPENYLQRVMAPFADARVGMVTCLYRGIPGHTLGSRLEAVGIDTDFAAGVLAARVLQGLRFGLGSTLAMTRAALQRIGGFEPLLDYLADDYELGARIAAAGLQVELSDTVVDHHLPPYSWREFIRHQLRWARAVRDARSWGYAGVGLTFGVVWAAAAVLLSWGAWWSWILLGAACSLRFLMAWAVAVRVLGDGDLLRHFYLLPMRDLAALLVWMASFAGHKVDWRGDRFVLKNGKLRAAVERE